MTGGILQVAAKGVQDIYLTGDPNITFFKTVYRRHTNFSRVELDLNFTNRLDFGKEGYSRIEHYGDLLHRLFLVIKLPKIDISFRSLTVGEVQALLAQYGIVWNTTKDPSEIFTEDDYKEVQRLVGIKRVQLQVENTQILEPAIASLTNPGEFYPDVWRRNNPDYAVEFDSNGKLIDSNGNGISDASEKYLNDIITSFIEKDPYNLQYQIINAHDKDVLANNLELINSVELQNIMLQEFINYAVGFSESFKNDDNLRFLYNVDTANYSATGSLTQTNSNTIFRSGVAATYPDTSYQELDAYKIFDVTLNNNNRIVTSTSDIQNLKTILMNNIRYGLIKNVKLMKNIYASLLDYSAIPNDPTVDQSKFIFYKLYPVITPGQPVYQTNSSFQTTSLRTNPVTILNDNFSTDFALAPEPNEPTNVSHPFSVAINTSVNSNNGTFHTGNVTLFNSTTFTPYFNDILTLWSDLDINTNSNTPGTQLPFPDLMYFMNYIWLNMTEDIPTAVDEYLSDLYDGQGKRADKRASENGGVASPNTITNVDINNIVNYLNLTIKPVILSVIKPKITDSLNYSIARALNDNGFKTRTGATGDILLLGFVLPGITTVVTNTESGGLGNLTIPEYIIKKYETALDDITPLIPNTFSSVSATLTRRQVYTQYIIPRLKQNVYKLFYTDFANIPTYTTYQSQNNNMYSDRFFQINKLGVSTFVAHDAQSTIWNYIFSQVVNNYNNLFNNFTLGYNYYINSVGVELLSYLIEISNTDLGFDITINPTPIYDYYRNIFDYKGKVDVNSTAEIPTYLDAKLLILQNLITNYDNNRNLLDMRNIILQRSLYYFQQFLIIIGDLTNTLEAGGNGTYMHVPHPGAGDIVLDTQSLLTGTMSPYPQTNATDIVLQMREIANTFFSTGGRSNPDDNPYNPITQTDLYNNWILYGGPYDPITQPNKYALWQKYKGTFNGNYQKNLYARNPPDQQLPRPGPQMGIFDWLYNSSDGIPTELFNYISQIDITFNGFSFEPDVYAFMISYIIQSSSIVSVLPSLAGRLVNDTHANVLNYYQTKLDENNKTIEALQGGGDSTSLFGKLEQSLSGKDLAKFAWIKKIGHYIIDQIWFKIDDQIIDKHYGEWLEVWHELSGRFKKKEKGYNTLIGNVADVYSYNTQIKNPYELVIPLQFWFTRNIGLSLPILALHNSDVRLYVKLKSFDDISFYDDFTTFRNKPKLKCNLLAEYIYVDDDERNKIATSKLEYIIDTLQYNGDIEVNKNSFNEEGLIESITRFKNPCKEIVWMLQRKDFINGSLLNREKLWYVYSYNTNGTINPIDNAKIKFNSRDREIFKKIEYYNYIQPYEKHYADSGTGVNVYSFSLNPESIQPEGSANMSRIDDTSIEFDLKPDVKNDIIANNIIFRLPIYALTMNVLRIFSGLAGLVFEQ